ncbi:RCC1/BLIP-II [Thozetella sp. PMI_491]|nr:RCC1/BLIP-II [Thozetella sp. PMI_491]
MPPRKDAAKVAKPSKKTSEPAAKKDVAAADTKTKVRKTVSKAAEKPKKAPKKAVEKSTATKKSAAKVTDKKKTAPATAPAKAAPKAASKKAVSAKNGGDESDKENTQTTAKNGSKRKREDDDEVKDEHDKAEEAQAAPPQPKKKVRTVAPAAKSKKQINTAPTEVLEVFVFGEGTSGELGLGTVKVDGKKPIDVKRPRINAELKNVVQLACGGMHAVALTADNTILTWGVNDQGALGRDTTWDGGLKDMDADDDDDEDEDSNDVGLNPKESNPGKALLPDGVTWVQITASDSATFALTSEGHVWGWGTFRSNDGILGFQKGRQDLVANQPIWIDELKNIVELTAGSNHVLARDIKGKVFAWGSGQQCQLARKPVERDVQNSLVPAGIGALSRKPGSGSRKVLPAKVACGSYHSFVVDEDGRVWAWGLNNYAELGLPDEAGSDGGNVLKPTFVESLENYEIAHIAGGEHHSLACTRDGKLLTWGRIDGNQVGLSSDTFNEENTIFDEHGKPRILKQPTEVPDIPFVSFVAAGTDHSLAVTKDGRVYSWGFSANYQTGQGTTDDIEEPTLIDNTAIREKKITWAGAGGQYSIVASVKESKA